jgi:voltage-gated potassium channel
MTLKIPAHLKELRFLQLTLYTLVFLIISPLLSGSLIFNILAQVFLLNSLLVSLSAGGYQVHLKWLLWSLWGTGVLCYLLGAFGIVPALTLMFHLLDIILASILLLACITVILTFIFRSHRVTLDTIFAAVMNYLLLAFIYAQFYQFFLFWNPQSFKLPVLSSLDSYKIFRTDMTYFSLVTISTLGYGDIVPQTATARMVAVVEAVTGQFFVAILVAWLVGTFISQNMLQAQTRQGTPNPAPEREWEANRQANEPLAMVKKDELTHQD